MPSTYTTNLGIQKPANGELSGAWGQVVNANSDILDNAINGVIGLTLSGTASTLTTANGEPSEGQYKVLVLGGSPSGTHTITIDPATAHKVYFVNNTTAQSVVFTQGSGGNVTIAAGTTAVIYSDGAGAGAAVTNITSSLAMASAKITGGTITGITDLAIADGGTGASTAADARTNLGLGTMATQASSSVAITGGSIAGITDLAVVDGGTGSSTAAGARTNLGLGTMATQASSSVAITGGTITGITDLAIAYGGTGASTAAAAISNLGLTTASTHYVPSGGIILWSGSVASIPSGWFLCNGANGTPNLRNRFVVGAGSSYGVGDTGGADTVALATANMPAHTHGFSATTSSAGSHTHNLKVGDGYQGGGNYLDQGAENAGYYSSAFTQAAGDHTHTVSGTTASAGSGTAHENRPPYYALAYIMKS